MSSATLIRLGGMAAMLAGALRIVFTFVPYRKDSVALEVFYLVIDVALLFSLLAIYFCQHEHAGLTGFIGFVVAFVGTALIVGPDGALGGIDIYTAGSLLISLGLSVLAMGVWRANILPRAVPVLWWLSTVIGIGGFVAGGWQITFMLAGVLFGLAFVLAGWTISRNL